MTIANKPTVAEVVPLASAIYRRHGAGCCLHITLDDGNLRDADVKFCLDHAEKVGHVECAEVARKLLAMSKTQRGRVYREHAR